MAATYTMAQQVTSINTHFKTDNSKLMGLQRSQKV